MAVRSRECEKKSGRHRATGQYLVIMEQSLVKNTRFV